MPPRTSLPLLPHPNHLRKQAKARLVRMRQTAPATRLAEAQTVIAQEYGFADWTALQIEVRRRAAGPRGQQASLRRADLTPLHAQRFQPAPDEDAALHTPMDFFRLGMMAQIGLIVAALTGLALVFVVAGPHHGVLATAWQLGLPLGRLLRAIF